MFVEPKRCHERSTDYYSSEPNEHFFGNMRAHVREFTLVDLAYYVSKLEKVFECLMTYDLKSNTSKSGYMHGFEGFAASIADLSKKKRLQSAARRLTADIDPRDAVTVDYCCDVPIVNQIEGFIIQASNWGFRHMTAVLDQFGMQKGKGSVFLKKFDSMKEIAASLFSILPSGYRNRCPYQVPLKVQAARNR